MAAFCPQERLPSTGALRDAGHALLSPEVSPGAPSTTAIVDDTEPNVLVAADLGFRAIRFLGAPRLRSDLRGLGQPLAAAG